MTLDFKQTIKKQLYKEVEEIVIEAIDNIDITDYISTSDIESSVNDYLSELISKEIDDILEEVVEDVVNDLI